MNKINWKQKLTSRKFWAAVIAVVVSVAAAFGIPEITVEQITAIISACAVLIAYIIGEGLVDASRNKAETIILEEVKEDEETGV